MKEKSLYDILAYYGMPKENIESAITQIAQGYGACRYLDGVAEGAKATGKDNGFIPLCTCKIVWDVDGCRAFPSFVNEKISNLSIQPSQAIQLGEVACVYLKKI